MKAPKVKDISKIKPRDGFAKKMASAQQASAEMVRKTFTITQEDLDLINELSVEMANERGKNVSASEALRNMIEAYRAQRS